MSRIHISPMIPIIIQTPIIPIQRPKFFKIMDISTFYMENISKNSLLGHIQCRKLEKVINAIFQLNTMLSCLFRSINNIPYLFHIHSCRYFYSSMFSLLHRIDRHRSMMFPIGCNIHQINIIPLT